MKKSILIGLAVSLGYCSNAQNIMPENDLVPGTNGFKMQEVHTHRLMNRICIDVNMFHGTWKPNLTAAMPLAAYPDALNTKISGLNFSSGMTNGMDAEIGYYLDASGRYGLGTGFMFVHQTGDLQLDNFHIEYRSKDNFNNTFRQSLTSTGKIKENIALNSISIPLLFKYKIKFSEMLGFNADAGLLFTLSESMHYKTNASFDYEAIYQYTGPQGNLVPVYDYSATPAAGDFLLTRSNYPATHSTSSIESYFDGYRNQGYNVGLGVKPNTTSGNVSGFSGSVGILLRPSLNLVLSHAISVNAGVYYLYQNFSHNVPVNYRLTNKVGEYSSLANTISKGSSGSYGITIGASYSFRRVRHGGLIIPVEDTSSILHEEEDEHAVTLPATRGDKRTSFSQIVRPEPGVAAKRDGSVALLPRQD